MSNGGLSGIGAGAVNFQVAASATRTEKSKQAESAATKVSSDSTSSAEVPRAAQATGKTLNVAA